MVTSSYAPGNLARSPAADPAADPYATDPAAEAPPAYYDPYAAAPAAEGGEHGEKADAHGEKADAHGEDDGHGHGKAKAQAEGGPIKLSNDEIAAAGIEVEEIAERVVAERVQATAVVRPT